MTRVISTLLNIGSLAGYSIAIDILFNWGDVLRHGIEAAASCPV